MTGVLSWEEPPPPRRGALSVAPEWMEEVRARPGAWALVQTGNRDVEKLPAAIRGGRGVYAPAGSWEAVSRKSGNEFRLYVRYVGQEHTG